MRDPNATGTAICKATGATARPAAADRDGDSIADDDDTCPDNAEDQDGFQDADGCPDADNDKDNIPDDKDTCPNNPETYNGVDDQDGCPDGGKVVVESKVRDLRPMGFNCKPGVPDGFGCKCPARHIPMMDDNNIAICQDLRPKGAIAPTPERPKGEVPATRPAAGATNAPTGYRCGPGGTLVLNKGCTCAAGRTERRDADGVSVCAKGAATTATNETKPAPLKPGVKPAPDKPVVGNCPSWKGDLVAAMNAKDYVCVRSALLPRLNDGSISVPAARYLKAACGALSDRACEKRAADKLDPPPSAARTPSASAEDPKPATPASFVGKWSGTYSFTGGGGSPSRFTVTIVSGGSASFDYGHRADAWSWISTGSTIAFMFAKDNLKWTAQLRGDVLNGSGVGTSGSFTFTLKRR